MSEKAITRYRLCNDVYADRYEHGIAQPCWDALKNQTDVVLVRDHEAALDTLKLALQIECEKNAAKDARIAELEQRVELVTKERDHIQFKLEGEQGELRQAVESWRDFSKAYTDLRTAIGEKAEISKRRQVELSNSLAQTDNWNVVTEIRTAINLHRVFAAELIAMLEEGE